MKKIIGFFVALALAILLTGCSEKHPVEVNEMSRGRSTYSCEIKVGNTDEITKGSVLVKFNEITTSGVELFTTKTLTGYEGTVSVTGLKSETEYRADLYCTISKNQELIHSWSFKTTKDGTESDPYIISDASQLVEAITSDYSSDSYYKLGNDIDFTDYLKDEENSKFAGICTTSSTAFAGNLDGDNHTIKNVTITADQAYSGFFGYVKGVIRNVTFENINVDVTRTSSTTTYVGAVCGYAYGAKFNNVDLKNSKVSVSSSTHYVGGLVGYSFATNILNSDVTGVDVKSAGGSTVYAGGLTAYICQNSNNKYGFINYSNVAGKLTVEKSTKLYYGGLVGFAKAGSRISEVISNVNATIASSSEVYAGGLIGSVNFGNGDNTKVDTISNVVAYGKITANVAGAEKSVTIGSESYTVTTSSDVLIGGLIGSSTSTEIKGAYVNVDLDVTAKMGRKATLYVGSVFGRGYEYHTALLDAVVNSTIKTDTTGSYKSVITDTDDENYTKELANEAKFEIHELDGSSYLEDTKYLPLSNTNPLIAKLDLNGELAADTVAISNETVKKANWDTTLYNVEIKDGNFVITFIYK